MCGRYRLSRRKQVVEEHFAASGEVRWGLIPLRAKDPFVAATMINARSETAANEAGIPRLAEFRRLIVPADGFYEWQKTGRTKQPYCFEVDEGMMFAFAGLWTQESKEPIE
jgi:putative SOS response-associated peptidase YedK